MSKAQNDDVQAQIQLANQYLNEKNNPAAIEEALYWFEKAANQGNVNATAQLVTLYLNNGKPSYNQQEGLYWLTRFALTGSPQAQLNLGKVLESLSEPSNHLDFAEVWYRIASDQSEEAQRAYASVLEKKFNAQRAKQVSSVGQLDMVFDDSTIELSPIAKSKAGPRKRANNVIYWLLISSIVLLILMFWMARTLRRLKADTKLSQNDLASDKRRLESQLKEKNVLLKQQKKQLETLYRQFKKIQGSHTTSNSKTQQPTAAAVDQNLSHACSLFGFKIETIPAEKQIKVRYKQLCKIYHPDLKGSDEEMKRLNRALKIIITHVQRK
ncbi:hypothetical protein ACODM8_09030 [Vibrio ostreicida]|uniref:J domain-containing protein n=1 Tax=Vibrio ostreicida TaxID=526588 RepID=A0ABT8BUW2_9VIBR|nr:J domain-containing protein [Vibrio ostreicida]MDN3610176.1 hypothetical protein [Vibrio ostreicida]